MSMSVPAADEQITIRTLDSAEDFERVEHLQRLTWGAEFTELVPAAILMISQKVGGIVAGAEDATGTLVGFVFGLTGLRHGRLAHWSHMLAVDESLQGAGIGRRLKLYQRNRLLEMGVEHCYWTYDPLVARNAHLNINRLGALPTEYIPDMYGADTKSSLHSGIGTDRFIVEWELRSPRVLQAIHTAPHESTVERADPDAIHVGVPDDIQAVKEASPAEARAWRERSRSAFLEHLKDGHRVTGFARDPSKGCAYYILTKPTSTG
jgi:predicted GNAT superfamily acetyltransferase